MKGVSARSAGILFWLPRLSGILGILFIGMFGLDVFSGEEPLWREILGFLVHSIPSLFLIVVLAIAWKRERFGALLFLLIAVAPFALLSNAPQVNALLAAPFALTGVLFYVSARFGHASVAPIGTQGAAE